jgi:hypothetical protein
MDRGPAAAPEKGGSEDQRMKKHMLILGCLAAFTGTPCVAEDRIDLEGTNITGNRELPKVLYIVPWKRTLSGELAGKPGTSLLDEALAPVDRDVFRRQVEYYGLGHRSGERKGGVE